MNNNLSKYEDDNLYEGIIDLKFFFPISDKLIPVLHKLNFTPNIVTILSSIFCLFGIFLYYKKKIILGILFFMIGYLFDCIDGRMARKYNQGSTFGMILDCISDILTIIPLFLIFFYETYKITKNIGFFNIKIFYLILLIIINYLLSIHNIINEALNSYRNHNDDNFFKYKKIQLNKYNLDKTLIGTFYLFIYKNLYNKYRKLYQKPINKDNINNIKKNLNIIKEFGPGNYNILIVILMYLFYIS